MSEIKPWTWNDAWVLMSIESAAGKTGTGLRGIISAGDYINRSIFSLQELKEGLEKLTAIKYIKIKDGKFFVTPKFSKDYDALGKPPRLMMKLVDNIFELLKTKKISEIVLIGPETLDEAKVKAAYEAYCSDSPGN